MKRDFFYDDIVEGVVRVGMKPVGPKFNRLDPDAGSVKRLLECLILAMADESH